MSFRGHSPRPGVERKRSPPPDQLAQLSDSDTASDDDEDAIEDDEEEEGLSLQRFESGAARPPRLVTDGEDDGSD